MGKLSIALTTYMRAEMTINSIENLLHDDRIDDIVILDDASPDIRHYNELNTYYQNHTKVRVIRQLSNQKMSMNKRDAVAYAKNDFCILFDSDNMITTDYIDALEALGELDKNTIYQPSFGEPQFDWTKYEGIKINKSNIAKYMGDALFRCSLNGCNYVVNPTLYCERYVYNKEIDAADTIHFLYNWLLQGGEYFIVPKMRYTHTVHPESGFLANIHLNMKHAIELEDKIKLLK